VANIIPVTAIVDGTSGLVAVDTGSPIVVLNPAYFPHAPAVGSVGSVGSLTVGTTTATDVPVLGDALISPDPAVLFAGVLGCSVVCQSRVSFNYRDVAWTVGPSSPPPGIQAGHVMPFTLMGGGTVQAANANVTLPKSRVVLSVQIEGAPHTMVVDTGSTYLTLRSTIFDSMTSDGRAILSDGPINTAQGPLSGALSRVRSVVLGDDDRVEADGVVVAGDQTVDPFFDEVQHETGQPIDGSLGGSFLHEFYVTIDYANETLALARYSDDSFAIDAAQRLGVALGSFEGTYVIASVIPGTDAADRGVRVGDVVEAIDGVRLATLTESEIVARLSGPPGTAKSVQFGAAQLLGGQTVSLKTSELLPL
jgi:hypothetical protein